MSLCERCELNKAKVRLDNSAEESSMYLCTDCYNEIMVEELEVNIEPLIESFSIKDHQGTSRTFHVERRLHPMGIYLEAAENVDFGYKFAVHGELNCNQQELLNKLIEKARRGTRKQQIEQRAFPSGQTYNSIIDNQITGLLDYDEACDGTPLVIVDGKPYKWEELGKMLMAYEGFQIKLITYDITDDVE